MKFREHYRKCIKSGMFGVWFPDLSWDWDDDKKEFIRLIKKIEKVKKERAINEK